MEIKLLPPEQVKSEISIAGEIIGTCWPTTINGKPMIQCCLFRASDAYMGGIAPTLEEAVTEAISKARKQAAYLLEKAAWLEEKLGEK